MIIGSLFKNGLRSTSNRIFGPLQNTNIDRNGVAHNIEDYNSEITNKISTQTIGRLVLIRHGKTEFNSEERWAGQYETKILEEGRKKAVEAGRILEKNNFMPDVVFVTGLSRTQITANHLLHVMGWPTIDIRIENRMLELHPGDFTGQKKTTENKEFIKNWRSRPDPMSEDHPFMNKEIGMPPNGFKGESFADVTDRTSTFYQEVLNILKDNKNILIVSHSNSLSAFISNFTGEEKKFKSENTKPLEVKFSYDAEKNLQFTGIVDMSSPSTKIKSGTIAEKPKTAVNEINI